MAVQLHDSNTTVDARCFPPQKMSAGAIIMLYVYNISKDQSLQQFMTPVFSSTISRGLAEGIIVDSQLLFKQTVI